MLPLYKKLPRHASMEREFWICFQYLCTVPDDFSYGTYILVRTQLILLLLRNVLTDIQCNRNNDNDTLCDILVVRVDAKELQTGL